MTETNEQDFIGCELPPGFKKQNNEEKEEKEEKENNIEISNIKKRVYGPSLEDLKNNSLILLQEKDEITEEEVIIGPPKPSDQLTLSYLRKNQIEEQLQIEERKEWERVRKTENIKKIKREDWMLSLPEGRSSLAGLTPRTFSKNGNVVKLDKSWLEIPGEEKSKQKKKEEIKSMLEEKEDESINEYFEEQRGPSLVEIYQQEKIKKMKKEKQEEQEKKTIGFVRPWDREKDLNTRYVNQKDREKIILKSKNLDSNFVTGQKKYL